MTIKPWYAAVEAFGPEQSDVWDSYIAASGLRQLREVVTLDGLLCPNIIRELTREDWDHSVAECCVFDYFLDLEHVLRRVGNRAGVNILRLVRNPAEECRKCLLDDRFQFMGYDLVDIHGSTSALTNCGGFPEAFDNEELSATGLLSSLKRTREVQGLLRNSYPHNPHANCDIWAIWRMKR